MPPADVIENENAFVVRADVPGFRKEQVLDIEKEFSRCAEARRRRGSDSMSYHRRERRSQSVTRRIALPEGVVESEIAADLSGRRALTITLPKPQQRSRARSRSRMIHHVRGFGTHLR